MWELDYKESWAPKSWCFWTVVLEKTFESPLDSRRFNQSILQEISPEYSLEGVMLKLKLQYFGHLMRRTDSLERPWCWERLKAGGERDDRGWDGWMASPTQLTWVWASSGKWWRTRKAWHAIGHGITKRETWLSNWTVTRDSLWSSLICIYFCVLVQFILPNTS